MYLITREMLNNLKDMFSSLMAELQNIKIVLAICFGFLLIICATYVIEKIEGGRK